MVDRPPQVRLEALVFSPVPSRARPSVDQLVGRRKDPAFGFPDQERVDPRRPGGRRREQPEQGGCRGGDGADGALLHPRGAGGWRDRPRGDLEAVRGEGAELGGGEGGLRRVRCERGRVHRGGGVAESSAGAGYGGREGGGGLWEDDQGLRREWRWEDRFQGICKADGELLLLVLSIFRPTVIVRHSTNKNWNRRRAYNGFPIHQTATIDIVRMRMIT